MVVNSWTVGAKVDTRNVNKAEGLNCEEVRVPAGEAGGGEELIV